MIVTTETLDTVLEENTRLREENEALRAKLEAAATKIKTAIKTAARMADEIQVQLKLMKEAKE